MPVRPHPSLLFAHPLRTSQPLQHGRSRRPSLPGLLSLLLLGMLGGGLLSGCERGFPQGGSEPTIDEDRFVAVMAELRGEMDARDGLVLPEAERGAILQRHGVTEDDLLHFADVHGPDVSFMHRVWTRVDSAMVARSAEAEAPGVREEENDEGLDDDALNDDALDGGGA